MSKFRVGDDVRLSSKAREEFRDKTVDNDYADLFVSMIVSGAKATVSAVNMKGVWLNENQFWVPEEALVLACSDIAIETHKALDGSPVEINKTPEKEEYGTAVKPHHYKIIGDYEVKDINKTILDSMEEEGFDISFNEAGWFQQAMQYFMRGHKKNGLEDYKKGIRSMQFVVESMEERNGRKN